MNDKSIVYIYLIIQVYKYTSFPSERVELGFQEDVNVTKETNGHEVEISVEALAKNG